MSKTCDASPMDNNIQFDLRELIRAAEMSGINPQQIPGDANPWTWEDRRAMSWRSNFRALNPAVAQQAETLLGGPLSLALQAAMDAGETLSVDLDRELKIRRPALHQQMREQAMQSAIDQIGQNRKTEAHRRVASTPTPAQLAEQLRKSKQEAINAQQGRVPMPAQISDDV